MNLGIFVSDSAFDYSAPCPRCNYPAPQCTCNMKHLHHRYLDHFSGRQGCKKFHIELHAHHFKIQMYDLHDMRNVTVQTRIITFAEDPALKQFLAPSGYILPSAAAAYCRDYQFT